MGQEESLTRGTKLIRKIYEAPRPGWDHDHCSFCQVKFVVPNTASSMSDEDVRTEGFTTTSEFVRGADYEWICDDCCADFAEEFGWVLRKT